jgi:malate dehydrogenase (oxaloacetate-decarboxylating)(NADP+)
LKYHRKDRPGKIEIKATKSLLSTRDLRMAYSPGVSYPCLDIQKNPQHIYEYTAKGNLVVVITNGTAVLGLGNIGPLRESLFCKERVSFSKKLQISMHLTLN